MIQLRYDRQELGVKDMKKNLLLFFLIILIPYGVHAESITYNVCKEGCEYDSMQDVFRLIHNQDSRIADPNEEKKDIYIIIKDGETYNVDFSEFPSYYNGRYSYLDYVDNTSASNFYLMGEDPNNRPTIYSGERQMSFEFYNAHVISFENLIMKNVETDNSFHGGENEIILVKTLENCIIDGYSTLFA